MRKLAIAITGALLAGIAAVSAPAASTTLAASGGAKVVIIVGATHGATATYRSYADQVYAEAVKYTSNVVKVYSPNATWKKVKAAVNGASVIVYLGHGNGWPSPYTYDPNFTTKDGFGLNADLNGDGKLSDYENKYYGEPKIETLTPAPNAVVLLFHLCYASGNSEPGNPAPSLSTARQRVDNYASAFLRAGARAVIADGHSHSPYYIASLFTTRQTIDRLWRGAPNFHNHVLSYPSTRSPGFTYQMDPDKASSGYYRALTGDLGLRTQDVTGASYASTGTDPATFVVPGAASVVDGGAAIYDDPAAAGAGVDPAGSLAGGTRMRIDDRASTPAADGSPVFAVHALDGSVAGFMAGSSLVPRDSAGPQAWTVDDGTGAFSPNGDGVQDAYDLAIRLSEKADWTLRIAKDGETLATNGGTGDAASITWAPAPGSVPDGTYRWRLHAEDGWGNDALDADGTLVVDTRAPSLSVPAASAAAIPTFTPNGDGLSDTVGFAAQADEPGWILGTAKNAAGTKVATFETGAPDGSATLTWDGRSTSGGYVADGSYQVGIRARDLAGNVSASQVQPLAVYGSLRALAASKTLFFPQDGDSLARAVKFSFSLKSAATVTWTVVDAAGNTVRTVKSEAAMAAGSYAYAWNGRDDAGTLVPRGAYRSVVYATNGSEGASQKVTVWAEAFRIAVSDATPARGQTITVTARSAEPLSGRPWVRVKQPGRGAWNVRLTRVEGRLYRARVTLRSGATGTLRLKVVGYDKAGRKQASRINLRLH